MFSLQLDIVKADRDYNRSEVEVLKTQIWDMQSSKQKLESAAQVRVACVEGSKCASLFVGAIARHDKQTATRHRLRINRNAQS